MPQTQPPTLVYLHAPNLGDFAPAVTLGMGLPDKVAGQPVTYMWKDLIHTGEYVHPKKKFHLSVSDSELNEYADNFKAMKRNGVEVPINVDHSEAADDNRGFLIDVKRENGTLKGLCQFIGEDAARTAARNRVSVGIDPDYKDGEGRKYKGGVIRHVALTPVPVVPDQQPFTIAASRAAAGGDVLTLAAANPEPTPHLERRLSMAHKMLQCSEDTLNSLHKHVPGLSNVGDDEKLARVGQHVETTHGHIKTLARLMGMADTPDVPAMLSQLVTAAQNRHNQDIEDAGGATAVANLSVAQIADKARDARKSAFNAIQENSRLRERLEEKDGQIQTLSAATVKPLDTETQTSVIESATVLAEACVASGALNPVTKDRLLSILTKDAAGKVNTLAMSGAANPSGKGPLVLSILRALKDNQRPPMGEQSGLQVLSRNVPGAPEGEGKPAHQKFSEFVGATGSPAL